ncbi:putative siderophore transport system ATP-binding protein YusV [Acaryochloris thomasi RCC1774]|uniref:Putative siderophore transport system ATP-binding protein YusV n=1 Tax=Acaryochloris thomasi RCC1774 TaxID=1764569 RepID=A0A2W1JUX7_9CYAN|nr:ABC transporter ATP-binding protein [Acaryochloris thomasi]PZD72601.1 putative siderophore transport system ATP-binding protein YusV [Acaryochloris thomasi RCC1774]
MVNSISSVALTTRNLTLAYEGKTIIESLNLAIPTGKITMLVGPNGCGKSTLLKGLGRLLKPRQGTVYLGEDAITKLSTKEIAKRLGLLPQGPTAPEGLTVKDLVAQGRYPHQSWLQQWSKEDEQKVNWALSITQMQEFTHCALDNLSGGQRQRAWIAMTLAQDTEILLLDEPTTYLDLAHQIEILDLLYDLNQQQNRTILMVLHDLNQACRYADHLVVVKAGKICSQGNPKQVMTEAMMRAVFGLESQIISDPVSRTPLCIPIGRKGAIKPKLSALSIQPE